LLRAGLVVHERARAVALLSLVFLVLVADDRGVGERQQPFARHALRQRRYVGVVDDLHGIELAVDVAGHEVVGDRARVRVGGAVGEAGVGALELVAAEADRGDAAAAARVPDGLAAAFAELGCRADPRADDLRGEAAGEPAVASDGQQPDVPVGLVLLEQRQARGLTAGRPGGLAGHAPDRARVGAQRVDALLGAAQPGRRHRLQRARDLLDVLDRA